MSIEKIKELWAEDKAWSLEDYLIEEGEWTQDGKYQSQESIYLIDGKYFQINRSRSGSYHSDWYYNDAEVFEVIKYEKVVTTVDWKVTEEYKDYKNWVSLKEDY